MNSFVLQDLADHARPSLRLAVFQLRQRGHRVRIAVLLCAFAVAGLFGRFPWKADEPYSFGIVWKILQTGSWLVPQVADQPFVEKAPLVYWLGALSALFVPGSAAHEASRLAVLVLVGVTAVCIFAAASVLWPEVQRWRSAITANSQGVSLEAAQAISDVRQQYGRRGGGLSRKRDYALLSLLLSAGTIGFVEQTHRLTADLGQLAGAIMALLGLLLVASSTSTSTHAKSWPGVLLGTGIGVAFMSKGLLVPGLIASTWFACLSQPVFRTASSLRAAMVATLVAVPWLVVWPTLLHGARPDLFAEWFWTHNVGRFTGATELGGNHVALRDRLIALTYFSFPAGFLMICAVWRASKLFATSWRSHPEVVHEHLARTWSPALRVLCWRLAAVARSLSAAAPKAPGHFVVICFVAVSVSVILLSRCFRDNYLLPILPAIVLLGMPVLALSTGKLTASLKRLVDLSFGTLFAIVLTAWLGLICTGTVPAMAVAVGRYLPLPYRLAFDSTAFTIAVSALVMWKYVVGRQRQKGKGADDPATGVVVSWSAGFATLWIVASALLMPWVDAARSYEKVFLDLRDHLLAFDFSVARSCVATEHLGESELAMFDYVTGLDVTRRFLGHSGDGDGRHLNPRAASCDWLLVLSRTAAAVEALSIAESGGWRAVWTGTRPADIKERLTLFRRLGSAKR